MLMIIDFFKNRKSGFPKHLALFSGVFKRMVLNGDTFMSIEHTSKVNIRQFDVLTLKS